MNMPLASSGGMPRAFVKVMPSGATCAPRAYRARRPSILNNVAAEFCLNRAVGPVDLRCVLRPNVNPCRDHFVALYSSHRTTATRIWLVLGKLCWLRRIAIGRADALEIAHHGERMAEKKGDSHRPFRAMTGFLSYLAIGAVVMLIVWMLTR